MTKETEKWLSSVLITIIIAIICLKVGHEQGMITQESYYQKEAIDRGYANYNPTNGVWQWK